MRLQDVPWVEVDPARYNNLRRRYGNEVFYIWQWKDGTFDIDTKDHGAGWTNVDHLVAQAVLFHLTDPSTCFDKRSAAQDTT